MNRTVDQLRLMFGGEPRKPAPEDFTPGARHIHATKKLKKQDFLDAAEREAHYRKRKAWKKRRWTVLLTVNLLFVLSYWVDVQLVEGSLSGSRFLGFHLIDLNAALGLMLAHKHIIVNLLIGTATVALMWFVLGGRSFCSWVCPYHLLSELAEKLHLHLAAKKIVKDHPLHRGLRTAIWLSFAVLAYGTGYTVYETISPTGIVSRALIYGPGVALGWIAALLAFEVLYSRRAWCRYLCPVGLTYGVVGTFSPVKIHYDLAKCAHEGECRKVCLVPHVLDHIFKGRAPAEHLDVGPDCTRCGMCVDVCPGGALTFSITGVTKKPAPTLVPLQTPAASTEGKTP
ncbi:MAG: NapH/MauN family ferredoxin-type protein [Myxococcaceae bacterium]|jgi:ferredoxin-type protein NapH|nr:NapH/MauN family ferredoxin-type protein [Myxococcaceae bacterium]